MKELIEITSAIIAADPQRKCLLVGGAVRDQIMGKTPKDLDVEVYNCTSAELTEILKKFGSVDQVGSSFGILKLKTETNDYDFSLPRRENKEGIGHKGFIVSVDPTMTPREAAERRDFTMNSLAIDLADMSMIDNFNGVEDIKNGILRATSEKFGEDPLRVLRGFQFAGRFGFAVEENTAKICSDLAKEYFSIAKERIWAEWVKWAEKSARPSLGLEFLRETDWIRFYPEIGDLIGTPQDPIWHPEGDVWIHTLHVVDAAAEICSREQISGEDRLVAIFAALCHDFAKPETTRLEGGRWRSPGHESAGAEKTERFLWAIGCPESIAKRVIPLVCNHLAHCQEITERSVRRLADRLFPATIKELGNLIEADHSGRPPLAKGLPENAQKMLELSIKMGIEKEKPKPIIGGKTLIDLGWKPGPEMGRKIKEMYSLQLDGAFSTLEEGVQIIEGENVGR